VSDLGLTLLGATANDDDEERDRAVRHMS
jgi:hypothetical protein